MYYHLQHEFFERKICLFESKSKRTDFVFFSYGFDRYKTCLTTRLAYARILKCQLIYMFKFYLLSVTYMTSCTRTNFSVIIKEGKKLRVLRVFSFR